VKNPSVESIIVSDEKLHTAIKRQTNDVSSAASLLRTEKKKKKTSKNNAIYLYETDFTSGTYRITEAGTYRLMEDIEFDFNANDDDPLADGLVVFFFNFNIL
jgi:hypothetical protein